VACTARRRAAADDRDREREPCHRDQRAGGHREYDTGSLGVSWEQTHALLAAAGVVDLDERDAEGREQDDDRAGYEPEALQEVLEPGGELAHDVFIDGAALAARGIRPAEV